MSFSEQRIYGRMRSAHWVRPRYMKGPREEALYSKIDNRLRNGKFVRNNSTYRTSLRQALASLSTALKAVDTGPPERQIELLEAAIHESHAVSQLGDARSLSTNLKLSGANEAVYQSREVLEIDKLSKYLSLSNDLIRLSRQPRTREFCKNLTLEICTAYPASRPVGSTSLCFVHGEVQVILFYEKNLGPSSRPPRAIGSSKSACFLCDLFIREHALFRISHSHMFLYPQWTIPETSWMNPSQNARFRAIIRAMMAGIESLLREEFYSLRRVVESRALVLQLERDSSIADSSDTALVKSILDPGSDARAPSTVSDVVEFGSVASMSFYSLDDLPISEAIHAATSSMTLLLGKATYIFDLTSVQACYLHLSLPVVSSATNQALNIRELPTESDVSLSCEIKTRILEFRVHDAGDHELNVLVEWS